MARTAESYVPEFEARLKRLLENEDSEQGRQISRRHGVVVHSKKVAGSDAEMIRASGTVDGIGAKELSQALWDIESRREWDKANISEWRVVRALDKDTDVHYMRCKGMFGMAERDFADMRRRYELPDQEAYAIVFIAVDVPEVPEEPPAAAARTPSEWFTLVRAHAKTLAQQYGDVGIPAPVSPLRRYTPTAAELEVRLEQGRLLADLERRLKRCDHQQLVSLIQGMAAHKAALLPIVAAGVAASAARRAELEELVLQMVVLWKKLRENSAERLMTQEIGDHHGLDSSELIELSNSRIHAIIDTAESSLQAAGQGAAHEAGNAEASHFVLMPVIRFNAEMHIRVNNYMEAIHLHALAKASRVDKDIKSPSPPAAAASPGLIGRLSAWWSPQKSQPALQARPHEPKVTAHYPEASQTPAAREEQSVMLDEAMSVKGLHSMQSVALRLNKKLELTSVKRLMRLNKYKAFSSEELAHVSNGHIISVLEQIQRVREQMGDWSLGQSVFEVVESSAELCLKVNDYAEAINQDTYKRMKGGAQ